jgi:hypothetical protein
MLRIAPWEIVLAILMPVLGDGGVGLYVIFLQGQEVIASLVQELCRAVGWAARGIDGHPTAVDGQPWQQFLFVSVLPLIQMVASFLSFRWCYASHTERLVQSHNILNLNVVRARCLGQSILCIALPTWAS